MTLLKIPNIMNFKISLAVLSFASSLGLSAQGLHQEINVDREIVPIKREAVRLNALPKLELLPVAKPHLSFSDKVVTTNVPTTITTLNPVAFVDDLSSPPYRGYVVLGVGTPLFKGTLSAGYRAIDNKNTRLSVYGQYDGDVYTQRMHYADAGERKLYWRDHTATLASDFHHTVGSVSNIDARLDYTYAYNNLLFGTSTYGRNVSNAGAKFDFSSSFESLDYKVGFSYRHFGFYHLNHASASDFFDGLKKPVHQNMFEIDFCGKVAVSDNSSLSVDIDADFLRSSPSMRPLFPYEDVAYKGTNTRGLFSITPHYNFKSNAFKGRVGLQIDMSFNNGTFFHLAPEASIAWTPTQMFGAEIKAFGGSELNSLATLYGLTPYISPFMAYRQSHLPLVLDGRVTIGPLFGASLDIFGGYTVANSWLMPLFAPVLPGGAVFEETDLRAYHVGAAISYEYRNIFSVRASYETAPNSYEHSYFAWRDRARHVVNAEMKLRPWRALLFNAGWQFRSGRRVYETVKREIGDPGAITSLTYYDNVSHRLDAVSILYLGATYSINERLSVFVRGENILNHHFSYLGGRYSQGANVILGASYKF